MDYLERVVLFQSVLDLVKLDDDQDEQDKDEEVGHLRGLRGHPELSIFQYTVMVSFKVFDLAGSPFFHFFTQNLPNC